MLGHLGLSVKQLSNHLWLGLQPQGPGMEPHVELPAQWGGSFSLSFCLLLLLLVLSLFLDSTQSLMTHETDIL